MKHYFICARAVWEAFPKENFASSHWIPTDDEGKILIVAQFPHEGAHEFWARFEGVEALPHLVFGTEAVKPEHHAILTGIGVKPGDRTIDVAKKAAMLHPAFHPERF
jgi:hypothetical protein